MKPSDGRSGGTVSNIDPIAGAKQDEDLKRNPGIGQSAGTSQGGEPDLISGENTVEGDIENDADAAGAVKLDRGRTNK